MDLRASADAHAARFFTGTSPPIQSTWNIMMRIMIARKQSMPADLSELRRYQVERLGRSSGESAMLELMPLPAPNRSSWPYKDIPETAKRFPTRESYEAQMITFRTKLLQDHLNYGPKLVVCYGSMYWTKYSKLFPGVENWRRDGVFLVGNVQQTKLILTPHFVSRQMNGQRERLLALCT